MAVESIAAPQGTALGGYWGRDGMALAECAPCLEAELTARVVYLSSSPGNAVVIAALDLPGICSDTAASLQTELAAAAVASGAPSNVDVLVCCTHTHTAPQTHRGLLGMGHADDGYVSFMRAAACAAAQAAVEAAVPALVRHVRAPRQRKLAVNRRQRKGAADQPADLPWFEKAGETVMGQRPEGPIVDHADALSFLKADDGSSVIGTLCCFACHPVCCGPALEQSADYVGACRARVEAETAGAPAVFITGACGDINPWTQGEGHAAAATMGSALGASIAAALSDAVASGRPASAALVSSLSETLALPLDPLPTEQEALAFLEEARALESHAIVQEAAAVGLRTAVRETAAVRGWAEERLGLARGEGGALEETMPLRVHGVRVGEVAILGIAGEPFSEYALALERASPFGNTIVAGYTDGVQSYLPTEAECRLGGYEVCHAFKVFGLHRAPAPSSEQVIMRGALGVLTALASVAPAIVAPRRAHEAEALPEWRIPPWTGWSEETERD